MKNLILILILAYLIIAGCTSSEHHRNTRIYSILGRISDTVIIPESVTILPDSDGCFRPYSIDIAFEKPCYGFLSFRCGSIYISGLYRGKPVIGLQNYVLRFPNELERENNLRIFNELIMNSLFPDSTNNVYINGENIQNIFMHGEKSPPFEIRK